MTQAERMTEERQGVSLPVEERSSCKIAVNAKGQYSGEIKVYARDIADAYSEAVMHASIMEALIRAKNNLGTGGDDGKN